MTEPFAFIDRRGRTASGLQIGGLSQEMSRLRAAGYTLPKSPSGAIREASQARASVTNRTLTAEMGARRRDTRRQLEAGRQHTAANVMMALPKIRQPLSSLQDKNIPYDTGDPKELAEIRRWARLFYSTHDLVPLLIDIYARFPIVGLEFDSKDPLIKDFYTKMFVDELNYMEFLPAIGREYFISGEVTTLAHFSEALGVWSSEEVLNPDMLRVSKSMFVQRERVQLLVKDMVDALRTGPGGSVNPDESPSEKKQRNHEYAQLAKHYPEIVAAASQDDGIDIADALLARIVNRTEPWAMRGTPHLLRSFRTLMREESLNSAQDAIADRLYSPFILARLGAPDLGDGAGAWIPDQGELDAVRDDMQSALAADFRLLVGHFGLDVVNVFGREAVPRFDADYDRIDRKLMQAWGIGPALIEGGSAAGGAYASSALNREFVTQMMSGFQNSIKRLILKRAEVIAEAQGHVDYEKKGALRVPLYRDVVEVDDETGEERIIRVPKLLLPEPVFSTLNLRDEAQERQFLQTLKSMGVPISDTTLAVNIPFEPRTELQRVAEETVEKLIADAEAMAEAQRRLDDAGLPYPPQLSEWLDATLKLRQDKAATGMAELQADMAEQQAQAMTPAGQAGAMPGQEGPPPAGAGGTPGPGAGQPQAAPPGGAPAPGGPQEVPRNRVRPPESDGQRAGAPRAAGRLAKFENGPSSHGHMRRLPEREVENLVHRIGAIHDHQPRGNPRVADLVDDPLFWQATNYSAHEAEVRADWPDILAGDAKESTRLLQAAVDQYEEIYGVEAQW